MKELLRAAKIISKVWYPTRRTSKIFIEQWQAYITWYSKRSNWCYWWRDIMSDIRWGSTAKFVTLIIDSTIDISSVDQLSLSLRYVTTSGHSREFFIAFKELEDGSAAGYFDLLFDTFKSLNLDLNCCRGQAYDGACTMTGIWNGLHQRVKDVSLSEIYNYCCADNLNLVLIDAASSCVSAQLFFGTLEFV